MKKIKLLFTALALVMLVPSCEDDGGDSVQKLQYGAAPDIDKVATADPSIDLIAVGNGEDINLSFTVGLGIGEEVFSSLDVVLFYIKGDGTVYKNTFASNVTALPATYTLNLADFYTAFEGVNGPEDIEIGDKLIVSTAIHLTDGTTINMTNDDGTANYGGYLATSSRYTVIQEYVVACPLNDASNFDGTYIVVEDDWADYEAGEEVPVEYHPEDGLYTFRILSTNNPYINNPGTSYMIVTIDPATSEVTVTANEIFDYGVPITVTGEGNVGSCTGDINLIMQFAPYTNMNQRFTLVKQ